jgi:hypothetical protein
MHPAVPDFYGHLWAVCMTFEEASHSMGTTWPSFDALESGEALVGDRRAVAEARSATLARLFVRLMK